MHRGSIITDPIKFHIESDANINWITFTFDFKGANGNFVILGVYDIQLQHEEGGEIMELNEMAFKPGGDLSSIDNFLQEFDYRSVIMEELGKSNQLSDFEYEIWKDMKNEREGA